MDKGCFPASESSDPSNYYRCSRCAVSSHKLWRKHGDGSTKKLLCYRCSGERREIDQDGKVKRKSDGYPTDQIGDNLIPAIPNLDSRTIEFWGYTASIPEEHLEWWKKRPSKW